MSRNQDQPKHAEINQATLADDFSAQFQPAPVASRPAKVVHPIDGTTEFVALKKAGSTRKYAKLPRTNGPIIEALRKNAGIISATARSLGVARSALQSRILSSDELKAARFECTEVIVDMAEGNVFRGVQAGDQRDSHFVLRTLGKPRGYSDRTEVTGDGGGEVKIVISPREAKL